MKLVRRIQKTSREEASLPAGSAMVRRIRRELKSLGSAVDTRRLIFHNWASGILVTFEGNDTLWDGEHYHSWTKAEARGVAMEIDAIERNASTIERMHRKNMEKPHGLGFEITRSGVSHVRFARMSHPLVIDSVSSRLWGIMVGDGYADEHREYEMWQSAWHGLVPDARRHRERAATMASGKAFLMIEATLAHALADMTTSQMEALAVLLRAEPKGPECGGGVWMRDRLAKEGVDVPAGVEAISVSHGLVHGRVRLSPLTTWNNGRLLHRGSTLPETIMSGLSGKPLHHLVEHRLLNPIATIGEVKIDGHGAMRARVETSALRYPGAYPHQL